MFWELLPNFRLEILKELEKWFCQKPVLRATETDGIDAHFKNFTSCEWVLVIPREPRAQNASRALLMFSVIDSLGDRLCIREDSDGVMYSVCI